MGHSDNLEGFTDTVNSPVRRVICGCHEGGVKAIEGMLGSGYAFERFVCLTPRQAEKYQVSGYYDYRLVAEKHGIPVYVPRDYSLKHVEDQKVFQDQRFDLLVQGGWQRLFPKDVLASLSIGALGLHGSADLLPKGRGRSPMNWSLIEGRKRFLMHLFTIKPGVDDGDVLGIREFDITSFDDIETMYYKYSLVYRSLLLDNLPRIMKGEAQTIPQSGEPSYYAKRTPEDGRIDWESMDVWEIYNFVRAQTRTYPGAFAQVSGSLILFWRARVFDTRIRYEGARYGEVVERFGRNLVINCRCGLLLVDDWEPKA